MVEVTDPCQRSTRMNYNTILIMLSRAPDKINQGYITMDGLGIAASVDKSTYLGIVRCHHCDILGSQPGIDKTSNVLLDEGRFHLVAFALPIE